MPKPKTPPAFEDVDPLDLRVYRLKVTLAYTDPPIWRRLEVYAGMEMDSLAVAIETLFGWSGEHMAEFDIKGRTIGDGDDWRLNDPRGRPDPSQLLQGLASGRTSKAQKQKLACGLFELFTSQLEAPEAAEPPDGPDIPTLSDLVPRARTKFHFTYDFGDNWEHLLEVEKILPAAPGVSCPRCTDGARANPIEDCGGASGFADLVAAVGHPKHERYGDLEEWGLKRWDPAKFSVDQANRALAKVFRVKS